MPDTIGAARRNILLWHDGHARDLPWCGEKDPYRIWVSEIMLQQTRAETATDYYRAFLRAFPTVGALAGADEQDVLKRWEGLGYYSRARNLLACARVVAGEMGGAFPQDAKELTKLPGIGAYTAGAIASIAFGRPEPAIDGNQNRVLARLFAIDEPVAGRAGKRAVRAAAEDLIDRDRPGDFNQALMGLGALICVPGKPDCGSCPAREQCAARALGTERTLPRLPAPPVQKQQRRAVALVRRGDTVLVRKRPGKGLLAGLWEFPNFEARTEEEAREALAETGITVGRGTPCGEAKHVFTHLIWHMTGYRYAYRAGDVPQDCAFVTADGIRDLPIPTALKFYREAALKWLEDEKC